MSVQSCLTRNIESEFVCTERDPLDISNEIAGNNLTTDGLIIPEQLFYINKNIRTRSITFEDLDESILKICRICLLRNDSVYYSLFESNSKIAKLVEETTQIEIHELPHIPYQICSECYEFVLKIKQMNEIFLKTNSFLRRYLFYVKRMRSGGKEILKFIKSLERNDTKKRKRRKLSERDNIVESLSESRKLDNENKIEVLQIIDNDEMKCVTTVNEYSGDSPLESNEIEIANEKVDVQNEYENPLENYSETTLDVSSIHAPDNDNNSDDDVYEIISIIDDNDTITIDDDDIDNHVINNEVEEVCVNINDIPMSNEHGIPDDLNINVDIAEYEDILQELYASGQCEISNPENDDKNLLNCCFESTELNVTDINLNKLRSTERINGKMKENN